MAKILRGAIGFEAMAYSMYINPRRPANPKIKGTKVLGEDQGYMTPPLVKPTKNDVEDATKTKVPSQSILSNLFLRLSVFGGVRLRKKKIPSQAIKH